MAVAERFGTRWPPSSEFFFVVAVLLVLLTDGGVAWRRGAEALSIGINYGQIGDNLPSPSRVSYLLRSMQVSKAKLYDADPYVLSAFLDTDVEFVVGIGNENVSAMAADPAAARAWVQRHVQPYLLTGTRRITCITVGNEVLKGNDTALKASLLPAMQAVYGALAALGLQGRVNVTTAHSLDIMGTSYPPSAGAFAPDAVPYVQPLLGFLSISGGCRLNLWGHLAPQVLMKLVEFYCSLYGLAPQCLLADPTGLDCWIRHCSGLWLR